MAGLKGLEGMLTQAASSSGLQQVCTYVLMCIKVNVKSISPHRFYFQSCIARPFLQKEVAPTLNKFGLFYVLHLS